MDDATFRGELAAGSKSLGGAFDQSPTRDLVAHETSYPASFSVLAADRETGQPTTNDLLTYVKTSATSSWKLASSSERSSARTARRRELAGAWPLALDSAGYVTRLGARTPPTEAGRPRRARLPATIARAFTSEASSGELPAGITAQFGPKKASQIRTQGGRVRTRTPERSTMTFSAVTLRAQTAQMPRRRRVPTRRSASPMEACW